VQTDEKGLFLGF